MRKTRLSKRGKTSISKLKRKADQIFSLWIRTRDKGICFTCGEQKPIKQMQNGHYISRSYNALRYDEQNCHCQCVACNIFKSGAMDAYALHLQDTYGPDILKYFAKRKLEVHQFTRQELEDIITKYTI